MPELKTIEDRPIVGFYICWGCHQQFTLYLGQKRHYCPACVLTVQKEKAGNRPNKRKDGGKPA